MKLSIFTPTHDPKHLRDIYDCLVKEDYQDWEWIIVINGGAKMPWLTITGDIPDRVKVVFDYEDISDLGIGALKSRACRQARGDVLIEMDHDDIPVSGFMGKIAKAFEDEKTQFVYTNFAEFHDNEERTPREYNHDYGWRYRDFEYEGIKYRECMSPPAEPPYILDVTHAPNHFRCWRRDFYNRIGGHDKSLYVGDDFDLLLRTYINTEPGAIVHLDECLYLYRFTGNNSYLKRETSLRETVLNKYGTYLFPALLKWARDNNLEALDLGSAHAPADGFKGVDVLPGSDVTADLSQKWPFEDNSVGVIRAFDFVEHIEDKIHFMNEAWRVLAPDGALIIHVPSSEGWGADQDPTHVSRWNPNSFWYFTNDNYKKYCADIACSFMPYKIIHYFPTEFHKQNKIPYVQAHLFAIKGKDRKWPMPMPCMMPHGVNMEDLEVGKDDAVETTAVVHDCQREDKAPVSDSGYYEKIIDRPMADDINVSPVGLLELLDVDPSVPESKLVSIRAGDGDNKGCLIATYKVGQP